MLCHCNVMSCHFFCFFFFLFLSALYFLFTCLLHFFCFCFSEPGIPMFSYFVKIVPTTYVNAYGEATKTNQYSVTEHIRKLGINSRHGLPG